MAYRPAVRDTVQRMRYVERALSFRILFGCAFVAIVAGVIASLLWTPLAYLAIPVFLVVWGLAIVNDDNVLRCPYCAKRVKLGASTCHHCGRTVTG